MRLIDKDYFIGAMEESKKIHGEYSVSINNFINSLKSAPTVDAEPVKHGHWIWNEDDEPYCSVCGEMDNLSSNEYFYRDKIRFTESFFCPYCGAKMDGERKEND